MLYDSGSGEGSWRSAECTYCHQWTVWRDDELIYPRSATVAMPHPQMPDGAKELYLEAREVLGVSKRAGTALARAALERLLRTLDPDAPKRADLATLIDRIAEKVPAPLLQMLTVIRVAGNSSLHVKDQPDDILVLVLNPESVQVVALVFAALNDLVEELITKPVRVAALYEKVPESIRAKVDSLGQDA